MPSLPVDILCKKHVNVQWKIVVERERTEVPYLSLILISFLGLSCNKSLSWACLKLFFFFPMAAANLSQDGLLLDDQEVSEAILLPGMKAVFQSTQQWVLVENQPNPKLLMNPAWTKQCLFWQLLKFNFDFNHKKKKKSSHIYYGNFSPKCHSGETLSKWVSTGREKSVGWD